MKAIISTLTLVVLVILTVSLKMQTEAPTSDTWFVQFPDANTRLTYNDYHNITQAHALSTGKGVKVGILGTYFGYSMNTDLYAGGQDFIGDRSALDEIAEHGFWMATTLREIAPDVEIYALNARDRNRDIETKAIITAIEWAIENDIDILTYSAAPFRDGDRAEIDTAVKKAIDHGIVTIFIHYDLDENILPTGFFPESEKYYSRDADLNVFHYDYNVLLISNYEQFLANGIKFTGSGSDPYFSMSSMSPVLAGTVAMMKQTNPGLPPSEYKQILIETSKEIEFDGYKVPHVFDAWVAVTSLIDGK